MKKDKLSLYMGYDQQAFNGTMIRLWGFVMLVVTFKKGRSVTVIDLQFLVVQCKSMYNCFLRRPFDVTIDIVASPTHQKIKYH